MKNELVTIKFDIYHRYKKTGRIEIVDSKLVKNECYTDNPIAEHVCPNSTNFFDVAGILAGRVLPPERCDEGTFKRMGIKGYNVYDMLRVTHGVDWDDFIWFKFDGEDITWDDVKVRG